MTEGGRNKEMEEKAKCCICNKEIKNVKKTENYCCDKCWSKYVNKK